MSVTDPRPGEEGFDADITDPRPGQKASDYLDRMLNEPGSKMRALGAYGADEYWLRIWELHQEKDAQCQT